MCATGFVYESENRCVRMKCLVWFGLVWSHFLVVDFLKKKTELNATHDKGAYTKLNTTYHIQ